uniref:Uncharacterized protein n=1 Tax=Timema monikensis TaxID=170555 RepID=A0A7R9EEU1_9NEOP|nr:unnamed protein product [Timema monikensis]
MLSVKWDIALQVLFISTLDGCVSLDYRRLGFTSLSRLKYPLQYTDTLAVRVMLRVNGAPAGGDYNTFFSVDPRKKQVTLVEPVAGGVGDLSAPEDRRVGVAAPKMFAFDAIFNQDDSQKEETLDLTRCHQIFGASPVNTSSIAFSYKRSFLPVVTFVSPSPCSSGFTTVPPITRICSVPPPLKISSREPAIKNSSSSSPEVCSSALTDVIHAVINGTDGVLFCFGHARLGELH